MKKPDDNKIVCRFCKQPITEGIYTTIDLLAGNYLVLCDDCKVKLAMYLDNLTDKEGLI